MDRGLKLLSDITAFSKYAKYAPNAGRRETWEEIAARNLAMHLDQFPQLKNELLNVYEKVTAKEVLPSMRSMQFAGKAIVKAPNRIFNCSYLPMDHHAAFRELMFLLLGGTGVGYSVQERHVSKLPRIIGPEGSQRWLIEDSIEGWAVAVDRLMKAYFYGSPLPLFDYSGIRPKGSPLKTSGGIAPGHEDLQIALEQVERILRSVQLGNRLTSIQVHDICCYIADCVRAGGIRRSAMIALFDRDDHAMLSAKSGDWWSENPQRARANNSAVLPRWGTTQAEFHALWNQMKDSFSGEPGMFWTNDLDYGTNPCLTGDTLVAVADGRQYVTLKALAEAGVDVPVYTLDPDGIVRVRNMRRPHLTQQNAAVYRIVLDNGSTIRATANHKFPLKTGGIKQVHELVPGDSLRTLVRFTSPLWNKPSSQEYAFLRAGGVVRAEHRVVAEHTYGVPLLNNSDIFTVHHKDHNPLNNAPDNLQIMQVDEHNALHRDRMLGEKNPIHRILASDTANSYRAKLSEATRGERNPNYSGVSHEELKQHAIRLTQSLGHPASVDDWIVYAKAEGLPQSFSGWRKTHLGGMRGLLRWAAVECGMLSYPTSDIRVIKRLHYYLSQGYDCAVDETTGDLVFHKVCQYSGETFVTTRPEAAVKPEYAQKHYAKLETDSARVARLASLKTSHEERKVKVREAQAQVYNDLEFALQRAPLKAEWEDACYVAGISSEISRERSPFRTYEALKAYALTSNHKVVAVEFDGYEDVYNGTVDEYHNFFIGQFVEGDSVVSINTMNCAEISLRPHGFCNLTTINAGAVQSQEHFLELSRVAAFLGTLQAAYTNFHFLRPIWEQNAKEEALLGVSMTGIASGMVDPAWLRAGAQAACEENLRVASLIGIRPAARVTAIKPEGTASLVLGTSSGIHPWHDHYYVRRMRFGINEPVAQFLMHKAPQLLEVSEEKPNSEVILAVPVKAPDSARTREEATTDILERIATWKSEWINPGHRSGPNTHNVSATVSIRDHEWSDIRDWAWSNRDLYTGLSFLPYDGGIYPQAPFETISKEEYERRLAEVPAIDLRGVSETTDNTSLVAEAACAGGACEIV